MIYWATPLQCLLCPMVGASMQMAGDNTSDSSSLPLARYPTSSPQQQASDHEGGSLSLKVSEGRVISRRYGAHAIPSATNGVTHAQLLGGSGQKLLRSQTGVSGNKSMQILHYLPVAERPDSSYKGASFPPHLQVATRLLTLFCNTQIFNS